MLKLGGVDVLNLGQRAQGVPGQLRKGLGEASEHVCGTGGLEAARASWPLVVVCGRVKAVSWPKACMRCTAVGVQLPSSHIGMGRTTPDRMPVPE
ncbi:hypothetical protein HS041_28390 [Planomonospora sp. ID67723]|uniref:hypothetical protein n=1 Tax=Planomonospora sp. ID67723 TaxID=2738134 RepID=UPI0018C391D0|nr:hypothetical protein [Planomonospora sp. ID67723]MBG0831654.1 hypothetical protein [Planomonospora sp. ID67723]